MSKFSMTIIALLNIIVCTSFCVYKLYDMIFYKKAKVTKMCHKDVSTLGIKVKPTNNNDSKNDNSQKSNETDSIIEIGINDCENYESDGLFKIIVIE